MFNFLRSLCSSDERAADSIVVGGFLALLALIIFTGVAVWRDPSLFNPINFGGAATAVITGWSGGRRLRDGAPTP